MRLLGLDVGEKSIGISISDPQMMVATGIKTINRENLEEDITKIKEITEEYQIKEVVLGYPKKMDGSIGESAQRILEFGEKIRNLLNIKVTFWDERFTTRQAEKTLIKGEVRRKKRKKIINTLSAVLILQNYLDFKNRR